MHGLELHYGDKDNQEIAREVQNITNLWNAYMTKANDSSTPAPIHPPVSLLTFYQTMMESDGSPLDAIMQLGSDNRPEGFDERLDLMNELLAKAMWFGASMFEFGQFCAMNGLLQANMVQCNCCVAGVEEALQRILNSDD